MADEKPVDLTESEIKERERMVAEDVAKRSSKPEIPVLDTSKGTDRKSDLIKTDL
jgi:hypothetical protein